MLNYKKLMEHNPTVYETITNKLGQKIDLIEHPTKGDMAEVICVCHELKLAEYSTFFDTDDMVSDSDYEPSFQEEKLFIGDIEQ